jgi:hypothetical protein
MLFRGPQKPSACGATHPCIFSVTRTRTRTAVLVILVFALRAQRSRQSADRTSAA